MKTIIHWPTFHPVIKLAKWTDVRLRRKNPQDAIFEKINGRSIC